MGEGIPIVLSREKLLLIALAALFRHAVFALPKPVAI